MSDKKIETDEADENYDVFADPLAWEDCLECGKSVQIDSMNCGLCEECF